MTQLLETTERPASPHAEMTVLGAMLVEPLAIAEASDLLTVEDFALDSHRRIFGAIMRLVAGAGAVDIVTVAEDLRRHKELESIGGVPYLASLSEGLPRKLSIESYVRILIDKAIAREIILEAELAASDASDGQEEAVDVAERVSERIRNITERRPLHDLHHVGAVIEAQGPAEAMLEQMATTQGIRLGFDQIDRTTHGLQPKSLVIVAARPSMGKTAWMCKAAHHAAVIERKVAAVFTLEQDKNTMIRRMLSIESQVDYDDVLTGSLSPRDQRLMLEQREILLNSPLYLDDTPGLTVSKIKRKCSRLKRTKGLDIVFVDQLSKVANTDVYQKGMQKAEWVGRQSTAFKRMAQELEVPVVVFNQLKRPENKGVVLPTLSDLKESGSLEEDADVVIFLHRPEYYDKTDESLRDKGQMILAKNREGKTDTFDCTFAGRVMRWEDGERSDAQAAFESYDYPYQNR